VRGAGKKARRTAAAPMMYIGDFLDKVQKNEGHGNAVPLVL
jgi:hypothetical protein